MGTMKAFWWFEEGKIAGMARPGFNHSRWFEMPYDEAIVMGWLGQHSSGSVPMESFREHLKIYAPRAAFFYKLNEEQQQRFFHDFNNVDAFQAIFDRVAARTRFVSRGFVANDHLHFETHEEQLKFEIESLKQQGIQRIVSLTEDHHAKDSLNKSFDLHHISIVDMEAPTVDQARELKAIIEDAEKKQEKIAVHCLAGIGRTSTTLMAAQMLRGQKLQSLLDQVAKQNPAYVFVGSQAAFLKNLAASLEGVV
jgi:protein-tyrosine phosphatase